MMVENVDVGRWNSRVVVAVSRVQEATGGEKGVQFLTLIGNMGARWAITLYHHSCYHGRYMICLCGIGIETWPKHLPRVACWNVTL